MEFLESTPSSFINYPHKYKFISFELYPSTVKKVTSRKCYYILDLLSDVGGIIRVFTLIFSVVTHMFVSHRFLSLLAYKMYLWNGEVKATLSKR